MALIRGFLAAAAALATLAIGGCTESEAIVPSASPSPTASASATSQPTPTSSASPSPTPSAASPYVSPEVCISRDEALEVLRATEDATEGGFTERYSSAEGSDWVLILNPAQADSYTAAWFDTATGEGELVFDGLTFSYAFGLVALGQSEADDEMMFYNVRYRCEEGGFSVSSGETGASEDFGFRYFVGSEGLLESGIPLQAGVELDALVQYEYSVEQRWLDALDVLVDELLSSF